MSQIIYIVEASGGEYEDCWTKNVAASFDKAVAESEATQLRCLNQNLLVIDVEVQHAFADWQAINPKPQFASLTINGSVVSVPNYTELFTNWLSTWYPNYVSIMEKHGIVPPTDEIVNWSKIQGNGHESTYYEVEEVQMITNMKEVK